MPVLSVSEQILSFVCGFGILQGVLLAFLIYFHRKSDKSVNVYLALYIFATSAIMSFPFILKAVGWQNSFFIQPVPLLSGPLLYLYIRSFKESISWQKALPHFLPFALFFFLVYWNISVNASNYPDSKEIPIEVLRKPTTMLLVYSRPVQQIIYYFFARKSLLSYQRSIRHLFSETSRIDMNWAKFLVNGYLVLVSMFLLVFPLILRFPEHYILLLFINMVIATPYIYMATYKGVMQHTIWQVKSGLNKETVQKEIQEAEEINAIATNDGHQTQKNEKSGLNPEKLKELTRKIIFLMEEEKLYQETELTLQQLADKLEVPTYQASLALNEGMKKNFYDIVNGYRVEEAKRLLLDVKNRNYTILSVGFEAGFNSKTTFNTVFKKFTGLTPTEYRDKQAVLPVET